MKTIDLSKGRHSLSEVLKLAQHQTILLRSSSGENFLVEPADEFDREAAALGGAPSSRLSWNPGRRRPETCHFVRSVAEADMLPASDSQARSIPAT